MRYDIAIIGTGPAGLEAAITAKVRNKNIILLLLFFLTIFKVLLFNSAITIES